MTLWKRIYSNAIDILRKYNYFKTESSYISVYIYSDRIEIVSPGALYGSNKLEKLKTASFLEVQNFTIIRILEELDYIENRYSGIPTMKREMEKYGLSAPEFYDERDCFKVILRNNLKDNNK
ncbi:aTP-dependent DNA helicase RecG C-terminal domain protein [Firmicutes bacterium CAG:582]|nr:aTP-dependent DNA helicase RecG C-terminal domain protein [Firmicutes bacterium CAG:582]